jgi:hypothetical protein
MSTVNQLSTFQTLIKILSKEMDINQDRIMIYNGEWNIPPDDGIFIILERLPGRVIANRNTVKYDPSSAVYQEIQDLNIREQIVISVFSKNTEALERKDEVLMAIASLYSQQLQEKNSIKIFRIANIEDLSVLEGGSNLYRYDIPLTIFSWQQKVKTAEYFDTFNVEVKANDGLPLIEEDFKQPVTSLTEGE